MAFKQISLDFDEQLPPKAETGKPAEDIMEGAVQEPVETSPADTAELVVDDVVREVEIPVEPPVAIPSRPERRSTRGRMKLSDMNSQADLIKVPEDEELFKKSYYSIGAVSEMFHVNISLIRFWENEFDILKPKKNGKGDRLFRPEDVKNLKMIYHLLREKKYTIEGAKEFLRKNKRAEENFAMIESLKKIFND
jgi:hypothetical protein